MLLPSDQHVLAGAASHIDLLARRKHAVRRLGIVDGLRRWGWIIMINAAKLSNLNGSNIDIQRITFDQSEEPCSSIPRSELGHFRNLARVIGMSASPR
jgi:hypothetical protein